MAWHPLFCRSYRTTIRNLTRIDPAFCPLLDLMYLKADSPTHPACLPRACFQASSRPIRITFAVDKQTRHALKQDNFVEATATNFDWFQSNRTNVIKLAVAVVVVAALVVTGVVLYN